MAPILSQHAQKRSQQRGVPPLLVDLLIRFGKESSAGKGASRYELDKQAKKRIQSYAGPSLGGLQDRLNIFVVVSGGGEVITVGHRYKRQKH